MSKSGIAPRSFVPSKKSAPGGRASMGGVGPAAGLSGGVARQMADGTATGRQIQTLIY